MLPIIDTIEKYRQLDLRNSTFIDAAKSIVSKQGRLVSKTTFPSDGSSPVVVINDNEVLKFFAPIFAESFGTESAAIKFLSSNRIPSPELIDAGEIDGWHYILMSKLKGQSLKESWPTLSPEGRKLAGYEVGKYLRQVHDLALQPGAFGPNEWETFLREQSRNCVERHEKLGLTKSLIEQIPDFLTRASLKREKVCFLHTEIMRDHVFFDVSENELTFTGFIDFEPSMIGAPEYDFASVGLFLSSGDREVLRSFFEGYGILDRARNSEFRRQIMAYALLHKYSNLKWYLEFMPNADSLEELADLWWAV